MKTVKEILISARARIIDPQHWCEGYHALDGRGQATLTKSPNATKWCGMGSAGAEADDPFSLTLVANFLHAASEKLFFRTAIEVNDELGHAEIIQVFDEAIRMAETQERLDNERYGA